MDPNTPPIDEDYTSRHLYETSPLQPITLAAIREEAGRLREYLKSALRVERPSPELSRLKDLLIRGKSISPTPLGRQARVSLHCDDESLTELSERVQRLLNKVWLLNLDRKDLPIPQRGSRIPLAKTRFASGIRREDWWLAADRCVYDETGNLVFDTKFRTTEGPFGERRLLLELLSRLGNIRGEIFIGKLSLDAREITLGTRAFAKVLRGRFTSRS